MRKLVLSIIVSIAAIVAIIQTLIWANIWQNENVVLLLLAALFILAATHIVLHFLRCRSRVIIPFIIILDGLTILFSLVFLESMPILIVVPAGALVYSTFYVYWIVKEREGLVWLKLIGFWIAVIAFCYVSIIALVLYRMALVHGG